MKKKVLFDNSVIECKRFPNIIYNVKKKTCLGVLEKKRT